MTPARIPSSRRASACLLICLLESLHATANPLTSTYLGAQTHGNEHLLLFKLPDTISARVLEQQRRLQPALLAAISQPLPPPPPVPVHLGHGPADEQSISLTIPLSTLQPISQPAQVATLVAPVAEPQPVAIVGKSPGAQLSLVDYLASLEAGHPLPALVAPPAAAAVHHPPPPPERPSFVVAPNGLELVGPVQQLQPLPDRPVLLPPPPPPAEPVLVHQINPRPPLQLLPAAQINQTSEVSNLLRKLSNSSPELLLRLRSLIRLAAQQQQAGGPLPPPLDPLAHNQTLLPVPLVEQLGPGHLVPVRPVPPPVEALDQQPYYDLNGNVSSSYATGQNVQSHEEIKIPLVVIAMPRILSLKRNQLASSSPQPLNTSSVLPSISSTIIQRLARHHLPSLAANITQNNLSNATSQLDTTSQLNYTSQLAPQREQQAPYIYLAPAADLEASQQPADLLAAEKQPQGSVPSSLATMAPYAHHFVHLPPLQSAPLLQHQPESLSPVFKSDHHQPAVGQFVGPLIETMIAGRQQNRSDPLGHLTHPEQADGAFQFQLLEASSQNEQRLNRPSAGQIQYVRPTYDLQLAGERRNGQQQGEAGDKEAHQQVVYLSPVPGRPANGSLAGQEGRAEERLGAFVSAVRGQQQQPHRISLVHEGIRKLRPLFQASSRRTSPGDVKGALGERQAARLSPGQMISLLSRATDRRASSGRPGDELDAKRKSKVVLMIV